MRPRKAAAMVAMENKFNVVSTTISLEKFECGSWASSTIIPDPDEDGGLDESQLWSAIGADKKSCLAKEANLPVAAAFVCGNKDKKGTPQQEQEAGDNPENFLSVEIKNCNF